jgi:hypothetical protein
LRWVSDCRASPRGRDRIDGPKTSLGRSQMFVVFVTALATWVFMLLMNVVDLGNFLVEGTIAVIGGAVVGLLVPWYRARQRRQNR